MRCRYGAAPGGLNGAGAELTERTLREVYLKPWRAFAKVRRCARARNAVVISSSGSFVKPRAKKSTESKPVV